MASLDVPTATRIIEEAVDRLSIGAPQRSLATIADGRVPSLVIKGLYPSSAPPVDSVTPRSIHRRWTYFFDSTAVNLGIEVPVNQRDAIFCGDEGVARRVVAKVVRLSKLPPPKKQPTLPSSSSPPPRPHHPHRGAETPGRTTPGKRKGAEEYGAMTGESNATRRRRKNTPPLPEGARSQRLQHQEEKPKAYQGATGDLYVPPPTQAVKSVTSVGTGPNTSYLEAATELDGLEILLRTIDQRKANTRQRRYHVPQHRGPPAASSSLTQPTPITAGDKPTQKPQRRQQQKQHEEIGGKDLVTLQRSYSTTSIPRRGSPLATSSKIPPPARTAHKGPSSSASKSSKKTTELSPVVERKQLPKDQRRELLAHSSPTAPSRKTLPLVAPHPVPSMTSVVEERRARARSLLVEFQQPSTRKGAVPAWRKKEDKKKRKGYRRRVGRRAGSDEEDTGSSEGEESNPSEDDEYPELEQATALTGTPDESDEEHQEEEELCQQRVPILSYSLETFRKIPFCVELVQSFCRLKLSGYRTRYQRSRTPAAQFLTVCFKMRLREWARRGAPPKYERFASTPLTDCARCLPILEAAQQQVTARHVISQAAKERYISFLCDHCRSLFIPLVANTQLCNGFREDPVAERTLIMLQATMRWQLAFCAIDRRIQALHLAYGSEFQRCPRQMEILHFVQARHRYLRWAKEHLRRKTAPSTAFGHCERCGPIIVHMQEQVSREVMGAVSAAGYISVLCAQCKELGGTVRKVHTENCLAHWYQIARLFVTFKRAMRIRKLVLMKRSEGEEGRTTEEIRGTISTRGLFPQRRSRYWPLCQCRRCVSLVDSLGDRLKYSREGSHIPLHSALMCAKCRRWAVEGVKHVNSAVTIERICAISFLKRRLRVLLNRPLQLRAEYQFLGREYTTLHVDLNEHVCDRCVPIFEALEEQLFFSPLPDVTAFGAEAVAFLLGGMEKNYPTALCKSCSPQLESRIEAGKERYRRVTFLQLRYRWRNQFRVISQRMHRPLVDTECCRCAPIKRALQERVDANTCLPLSTYLKYSDVMCDECAPVNTEMVKKFGVKRDSALSVQSLYRFVLVRRMLPKKVTTVTKGQCPRCGPIVEAFHEHLSHQLPSEGSAPAGEEGEADDLGASADLDASTKKEDRKRKKEEKQKRALMVRRYGEFCCDRCRPLLDGMGRAAVLEDLPPLNDRFAPFRKSKEEAGGRLVRPPPAQPQSADEQVSRAKHANRILAFARAHVSLAVVRLLEDLTIVEGTSSDGGGDECDVQLHPTDDPSEASASQQSDGKTHSDESGDVNSTPTEEEEEEEEEESSSFSMAVLAARISAIRERKNEIRTIQESGNFSEDDQLSIARLEEEMRGIKKSIVKEMRRPLDESAPLQDSRIETASADDDGGGGDADAEESENAAAGGSAPLLSLAEDFFAELIEETDNRKGNVVLVRSFLSYVPLDYSSLVTRHLITAATDGSLSYLEDLLTRVKIPVVFPPEDGTEVSLLPCDETFIDLVSTCIFNVEARIPLTQLLLKHWDSTMAHLYPADNQFHQQEQQGQGDQQEKENEEEKQPQGEKEEDDLQLSLSSQAEGSNGDGEGHQRQQQQRQHPSSRQRWEGVSEALKDPWSQFVRDIFSKKKLTPRESKEGRMDLLKAILCQQRTLEQSSQQQSEAEGKSKPLEEEEEEEGTATRRADSPATEGSRLPPVNVFQCILPVDLTSEESDCQTPFSRAASEGDVDALQLLTDHFNQSRRRREKIPTVAETVAAESPEDEPRTLCTISTTTPLSEAVNRVQSDNTTALIQAVFHNHVPVVEILLQLPQDSTGKIAVQLQPPGQEEEQQEQKEDSVSVVPGGSFVLTDECLNHACDQGTAQQLAETLQRDPRIAELLALRLLRLMPVRPVSSGDNW